MSGGLVSTHRAAARPVTEDARHGHRARALIVSVFVALLVLPQVGHHLIIKSDEARFALLARDILDHGSWLDARVEGERYRNKPPLFFWSVALLSRLRGGVTEATAQLPAALAAIGAALFTFLLGERLFNARAGMWAAAILATSASFFVHSQQILPDMLVLAFASAATYAFWGAMNGPRPRSALVGFYAALAFGVFAKGPAGLLPMLGCVIWLIALFGVGGVARLWSPVGIAVFAALTLGWVLPFLAAGSQSFGEHVLRQDWLATYIGPPLPRRVISYLGDALAGFLPWSILLPLALPWAFRARKDPAVLYALVSFLAPLFVIVFSRSRLPRYLLPVYPGAALLVAWWADAHGRQRSVLGRILGWASFAGIAGALTALPLVGVLKEVTIPPEAIGGITLPVLVCAFLLGVVLLLGLDDARPALLVWGGVAVMAVALGYGAWVANKLTDRSEDFRVLAAIVKGRAPDANVRVFTQAKLLPLDFYFGRELPRILTATELRDYVAREARPTVLIDRQDVKVTPPDLLQELRVLETLRFHEQELFILGCGPAERSAGSARCAGTSALTR